MCSEMLLLLFFRGRGSYIFIHMLDEKWHVIMLIQFAFLDSSYNLDLDAFSDVTDLHNLAPKLVGK